MKRISYLVVIMFIFFVVSGVTAGILSASTSKVIGKTYTDKIKAHANTYLSANNKTEISSVEITIDDPQCSNGYCIFHAHQEGVMDSTFKIPSEYKECSETDEETGDCITEVITQYTDQEIRDMADDYVEARLTNYASALIQRESKQTKNIGGDIAFN